MNTHQIAGVGASLFLGLTFLSDLSYNFGAVAAIFPPEIKKWVTIISASASVILLTWHTATSKASSNQPDAPVVIPSVTPQSLPTSILTK